MTEGEEKEGRGKEGGNKRREKRRKEERSREEKGGREETGIGMKTGTASYLSRWRDRSLLVSINRGVGAV